MMISYLQSLLCKCGAQGLKGGQTMPSAKRWAAYAICTFLKQNGMILTLGFIHKAEAICRRNQNGAHEISSEVRLLVSNYFYNSR